MKQVQKEVQKEVQEPKAAQAWVLPLLGMFAMLALAAGVGLSVIKRTAVRSTRTRATTTRSTVRL